MTGARADLPRIVLDTNVLLDWLVFKEPTVLPLVAALEAGTLLWVACPGMRSEFERTLGYDNLASWSPDREHALAVFDRHAVIAPMPATLPTLRCSDPDDQVFLDLAVATGARWLVTHDRALLRLARRTLALGPEIVKPAVWRSIYARA